MGNALAVSEPSPIVIVAGPTASGKSALALDIAEAFAGSLINADSMQVYAELRVLTARPGTADLARAPHHLFGVLPAAEAGSAGRWLEMALGTIAEVRQAGRLPIIVGGTGLYLKALTEGLAPVPEIPDDVNAEARRLHQELGGEAFRERLAEIDPESAARLPAGDSQRLVRAYAVARATGRPLADWQADDGQTPPGPFVTVALEPPRDDLYRAIDARFEAMLAAGALDEVRGLAALGLAPELPAMKALGVPELIRHLGGECSLEEAADRARQATRNFAKRQTTWLRHQLAADHVVESLYTAELKDRVLGILGPKLRKSA